MVKITILLVCAVSHAQVGPPAAAASAVSVGRPADQPWWTSVAQDEKAIFTSPVRVRPRRLLWLAPAAGSLAWLAVSASKIMRERVHTSPGAQDRSVAVSNAGLAALGVLPAYLFWRGRRSGDDDARN